MNTQRIRRVLIYRLGSLGDTVVAVPALHLIERSFPAARRVLLTNMRTHANAPAAFTVLEGSGLVHDFIEYPFQTRSVRQLARLWWKVVRFRPQVLVYLIPKRGEHSLLRDRWFFRLCGASQIIGLPEGDLAQPVYNQQTKLFEHESARLMRSIRSLGHLDLDDLANWDLRLTQAEQDKASELLGGLGGVPLIACGPGTKMPAKDWGQENWRELLGRLSAEWPRHGLILVGAEQDFEVSNYISEKWAGPVVNLCGLPPRETAAVLRQVELFLGPDSGQMHLSAALGTPCAIAFASRMRRGPWYPTGEGHEVVYHELPCSLCGLEVCVEKANACLTSISVDEMLAAAIRARKNRQLSQGGSHAQAR